MRLENEDLYILYTDLYILYTFKKIYIFFPLKNIENGILLAINTSKKLVRKK